MRSLALTGLLTLALLAMACATPRPGLNAMTHLSQIDQTEQPYGLYIPGAHDPEGEPVPLAILLHGLGATWETYWTRLPVAEWAEETGIVVATPHGRGNWYYVGPGEIDVLEVIEEVQRLCNVDPDRIYLLGHSMGGWGTWQLGVSHPDLFAAIVPMAGWAPLDQLPNLSHTAVFVMHGDDDVIVPVERAREAADEMAMLGLDCHYFEAPTWGHHSALVGHMLPVISRWMLLQERPGAPPDRIALRTRTPSRGAQWGVRVLRSIEFPDLASLDVSVASPEGAIAVATNNVASFAITPRTLLPQWEAGDVSVEIDGGTQLTFAPLATGEVMAFSLEDETWTVAPFPSSLAYPIVAHLSEPLEEPVDAICRIMAEAAATDTAIMRGVYACPGLPAGDVSADNVLDLYLRPMDGLFRADLPASAIAELTESGRNVAIPAVPLDDPDRIYSVAVTEYISRRLPEGFEADPMGISMSEALFDHVATRGTLP